MIKIILDKRMKNSAFTQLIDQLKIYHVQSALDDGAIFPDYQVVAKANHLDADFTKKAYDQLVKDGYLTRQNTQYLIRRLPLSGTVDGQFDDIFANIKALGMTPSFKTLSVEIKDQISPELIADKASKEARYVKLIRVFYADQIPLIHAEAYYDVRSFPDFTDLDFNTLRIFQYLEKTQGRRFAHYHQEIDVVQAPASINELLNQPANASVFRMKFHARDQKRAPMEYSIFHASILYTLKAVNDIRPGEHPQ